MRRLTFRSLTLAAALVAAPLAGAAAQTLHPAFQPPRIVAREYNFAIADGDDLTSFLFQWHEGLTGNSGLRFDVGLADPEVGDVSLLAGFAYNRQLNRANRDLPLDLMLSAGANALAGETFALEIPVGVSVGHRFPLEGGLAFTPFVHPRAALQYCSECGDDGDSDTDLGLSFDIGADFEVSSRLSLRAAFMLGSDDADAIGFSLAWRPAGLRR